MKSFGPLGRGLVILLTTLAVFSVTVSYGSQVVFLEETKNTEISNEFDDHEIISSSPKKLQQEIPLDTLSFIYQPILKTFYILEALQSRAPPSLF